MQISVFCRCGDKASALGVRETYQTEAIRSPIAPLGDGRPWCWFIARIFSTVLHSDSLAAAMADGGDRKTIVFEIWRRVQSTSPQPHGMWRAFPWRATREQKSLVEKIEDIPLVRIECSPDAVCGT